MRAFGGMLSFELDERQVDTALFLRRLKLITPAVSLGGDKFDHLFPGDHLSRQDVGRREESGRNIRQLVPAVGRH